MVNSAMRKALKEKYAEAREEAFVTGQLDRLSQNTGAYTPKMLWALRDMARYGVFPDGSFGDEECAVWEMFAAFRKEEG